MPQGRDEAGNIWEYDGLDANGEPINARPARNAQSPRGTVYTPPPAPKPPREPPTGYRWDASGNLQIIPGGPADKPDPNAPGSTPDVTAKIRADALKQFTGARMLRQAQSTLVDAFNKGPGKTSGLTGLADFMPGVLNESNQNFNKDAEAGRGMVVQGLGLTGGSVNSMAEAKMWTGPYAPTVSDWDSSTRQSIDRLAPLREAAARDSISVLGGVPDLDGTLHPIRSPRANQILADMGLTPDLKAGPIEWKRGDEDNSPAAIAGRNGDGGIPTVDGNVQGGARPPNVWMQESAQPPTSVPRQGSALNAVTGNTNTRFQRFPDTEAKISQAFAAGASLEQLNQILASDPRTAGHTIRPADYAEGARMRQSGRKGDVTFTVGAEVPLTRREEFSGSPTASALAGFSNMVSLGGVEAIAPQQYGDQKALNPKSAFAGEIAGAVAGSEGLGWAGRQISQRVLPKLLGGGGKARFGRQVAQDAAYGAGYGGVANGDPVTGALLGGGGSAGGQLLGKVVGKGLAGLKRNPNAILLDDAGVQMTVGQNLGGMAMRAEDRAMSMPGIGDIIRNRRLGAFEDYNTAEFANAGKPIGFAPPNIRSQGIGELDAAKGAAYRDTLDPVSINVLDDPQFIDDIAQAQLAAGRIPNVRPTFPRDFSTSSLNNRIVDPVSPEGLLTGRNFQEGYRGLARDARSRADGDYGHEIGETARKGQNALAGALERQNPGAYTGFQNANTANRNISVLRDAVHRARSGSRTGDVEVFAPSQMIDSAAANARKFPGGYNTDLAKAAQRVLPPTIPDSGSAGRLLQVALPTALVGGAGGGYMGGEDGAMQGAGAPLALAALLALGGSKGGQAALNKALFSRKSLPARGAKVFGTKIDEQKGLLGSILGGYLNARD